MKKCIFWAFWLMPLWGLAQPAKGKDVIERISQASAAMQSMTCDFVQTKHLRILSEDMVAQGKLYYEQPGKLRWEYTAPYVYVFLLNGNQVLLRNDSRTDVIDLEQNKLFREIARLMMSSIAGQCVTDDRTFQASVKETSEQWIVTLVPLKRDIRQMWTKLLLHFNRDTEVLEKVEMCESSGDYTVITLRNVKRDQPIDREIFSINQ